MKWGYVVLASEQFPGGVGGVGVERNAVRMSERVAKVC